MPHIADAVVIPIAVFSPRMSRMVRMSHSVLICEIREIRGQKLFHALPWIIEDKSRSVFQAIVTLGCGRSPRWDLQITRRFRTHGCCPARSGFHAVVCPGFVPFLCRDLVTQKLFKCIQPLFAAPQNCAICRSPRPALHAGKDTDVFFEDLIRQPTRKVPPQVCGQF